MLLAEDRMAYNFVSKEEKHAGKYEWNESRSRLTLTRVMGDSIPTTYSPLKCWSIGAVHCPEVCAEGCTVDVDLSPFLRACTLGLSRHAPLIPLDFSKQAINRVDSTFITRLLLTVKLNCATTCLFSTFHGEGRRTESCSTVLRISTLRRLLDYVHHNFSLGTNSKTNQTKKGEESPPLPQSNIVYKILLGKYLHFFFWILKAFP